MPTSSCDQPEKSTYISDSHCNGSSSIVLIESIIVAGYGYRFLNESKGLSFFHSLKTDRNLSNIIFI